MAARTLNALTGAGTISNTSGLTVQSGEFGGVMDGSNIGGLTKTGAGTLTLTGANAYSGPTLLADGTLALLADGTLVLRGDGSLGASPLLDLRGGILDISNVRPASLSLPDLDLHGSANLNMGSKTADFSGRTLSFYVPASMGAGGTLLTVSGTGTADISNSLVRVGIEGESSPLGAGDAVTLMDVPDGSLQGRPANTSSKGEGMQGVTLRYEFDLAADGQRLTASVARRSTDQAKALSEGWLSGMALPGMGADLAAGPGLDNARQAAEAGRNQDQNEGQGAPYGLAAFAAVSGTSALRKRLASGFARRVRSGGPGQTF